jgi:hypothetical protein
LELIVDNYEDEYEEVDFDEVEVPEEPTDADLDSIQTAKSDSNEWEWREDAIVFDYDDPFEM